MNANDPNGPAPAPAKCGCLRWWPLLLPVVAGLLVFLQVTQHDFVSYDDTLYVTACPRVQEGLSWSNLVWAFRDTHAANWHPLTILSHMLDVDLFGLNPGGHHLTSLLLHLLNSLLLAVVLLRMTGMLWPAVLTALLFAIHPLHVESVAWIAERKDVLSGGFFMLTLLAYQHYTRQPGRLRYWAVAGAFTAGLMAKAMLVTVPFLLLLLDWWPLHRWQPDDWRTTAGRVRFWALVREKVPLLLLSAVIAVVTYGVQRRGGGVNVQDLPPFPVLLGEAVMNYGLYLGKTFYPVNLGILYHRAGDSLSVIAATSIASGLVLITGLVLAVWRRQPWLAVGWFWFLGMLVPVIGLVPIGYQSLADRYTYLPLIGIFIMLCWGLPMVFQTVRRMTHREKATGNSGETRKWWLPIVLCLGFILLGSLAYYQTGFWKNDFTLFSNATEVSPASYRAHFFLGAALDLAGRPEAALAEFQESLRLKPNQVLAFLSIGFIQESGQQPEEAIASYAKALELEPGNATALFNRGSLLYRLGRYQEAFQDLQQAVTSDPAFQNAQTQLARMYAACPDGRWRNGKKALAHAEIACRLTDQRNPFALAARALAEAETGRFRAAEHNADRALTMAAKAKCHELVAEIRQQLEQYRQSRPWRDTVSREQEQERP